MDSSGIGSVAKFLTIEGGRMHPTGEYSISDLAEVFSVSRPTVYRTLARISAKNVA
jgi:DNA-binding MarR family transcriptional regulator